MTDPRTLRTRENLAWAAGLWEGEGCFSIGNGVPFATLASTDIDVVERLAAIMGFGHFYAFTPPGTRRDGTGGYKDALEWRTTTFEGFQATVAMLWMWLAERRRARAAGLLLDYREKVMQRRRGYHGGKLTLAGELFGKRKTDLTPAEDVEYRRVQTARYRARRRANGQLRARNPRPASRWQQQQSSHQMPLYEPPEET